MSIPRRFGNRGANLMAVEVLAFNFTALNNALG
ncbi:MAG: hypothetical protein ACJAU7_001327 [Parvibaculaceae bacterium]|jgi:hypothetical protein